MEALKFTKVRPGDILVFNYKLAPDNNAIASINESILSEGITGTWIEPYKKFKVESITKSSSITLKVSVLDLSKLTVGSTFNFGKYQVESETPWPIEWEIVHQTSDYQIAMTKQIIDLRCFDAEEPTNTNESRRDYGNASWQYSNIEQFLNSDQASWYNSQHQYDAPPISNNVYYNSYDTHKGFLYYWSNEEKALLKDYTFTLANHKMDGNGSYTWAGKVFLPTYTQMGFGNNNSISEGTQFSKFTNNSSRIKSINKYCAENNLWCKSNSKTEGTNYEYWMSSVVPLRTDDLVRTVNNDGSLHGLAVHDGRCGLAPCICLPRSNGGGVINNTITFYINNVEYKCPSNYTFAQWVNTSYNYNGWYNDTTKSSIVNYNDNTHIDNITPSTIIEDGKNYKSVLNITIISFTIDETSYTAEKNMTWDQWVSSSYNTGNYKISNNEVVDSTGTKYISDVTSTSNIIEGNKKYTTVSHSPKLDLSTLSLGSTFNFGKYQVESETPWPIEWEIVHQTSDYQIAMTKQIIDLRCFDAKESNNTDSNRKKYGNNNWSVSNIKQFLNSDQATWYSAQHQYDAPPTNTKESTGKTGYDTHKGFLYYFSDEEKALLKDYTLTLANPTIDGGGSYTWTGKVWLPTNTQMSGYKNNNSIAEGTKFDKYHNSTTDDSRIKSINKYCAENNPYCKDKNITEGTNWRYLMSSASISHSDGVINASEYGTIYSNTNAFIGYIGLAPCICLPKN